MDASAESAVAARAAATTASTARRDASSFAKTALDALAALPAVLAAVTVAVLGYFIATHVLTKVRQREMANWFVSLPAETLLATKTPARNAARTANTGEMASRE